MDIFNRVSGIINKKGKILVARRLKEPGAGLIDFPSSAFSGSLPDTDEIEDLLYRVTGLSLEVIGYATCSRDNIADSVYRTFFFYFDWKGGRERVLGIEYSSFFWEYASFLERNFNKLFAPVLRLTLEGRI